MPGGQVKFFADQIEILHDKNLLVASGNVVFHESRGAIAAEQRRVQHRERHGHVPRGRGHHVARHGRRRAQFGNQDPDVYFWGETIEKLGDEKYRITRGGFTTCVQPTPRWEVASEQRRPEPRRLRDRANTVLRVKGVPLIYLPVVYYPIQDDQRATGIPDADLRRVDAARDRRSATPSSGRSAAARTRRSFTTGSRAPARVSAASIATSPRHSRCGNVRFYRFDQHEATYTRRRRDVDAAGDHELRGHRAA